MKSLPYLFSAVLAVMFIYYVKIFINFIIKSRLETRLDKIKQEKALHFMCMKREEVSPLYSELFDMLTCFAETTIIPSAVRNIKARMILYRFFEELEWMSRIHRYPMYIPSSHYIKLFHQMCDTSRLSIERMERIHAAITTSQTGYRECSATSAEAILILDTMESKILAISSHEPTKQKDKPYKTLLLEAGYTEEQLVFMVQDVPEENQAAIFQEEYETILKDL